MLLRLVVLVPRLSPRRPRLQRFCSTKKAVGAALFTASFFALAWELARIRGPKSQCARTAVFLLRESRASASCLSADQAVFLRLSRRIKKGMKITR